MDKYRSIAAPSEGLYKASGSRFIAYAYPLTSEAEVKEKVDALRKEHHAARHHCYAYRIGLGGKEWRANDDGEPSGTAGRPILGSIDSAGLSDVLIVVVRYFGGILLGVPGLIKAYKDASADAIANASIIEKTACAHYRLEFGYESMESVMRILKDMDIQPSLRDFSLSCLIEAPVPLDSAPAFEERAGKIDNLTFAKI
ncbi:MAG: YigZ family protein [Bacteroidales bacterium]|nr:YigZ family protein [Bacteroidales bacterium]